MHSWGGVLPALSLLGQAAGGLVTALAGTLAPPLVSWVASGSASRLRNGDNHLGLLRELECVKYLTQNLAQRRVFVKSQPRLLVVPQREHLLSLGFF